MPKNRSIFESTESRGQHIRPPNPPWVPLQHVLKSRAMISYYYSDPLSKIPVRNVSSKNDPKADPNIETLTFGVFSTCDKGMRASIVKQGIDLHFFCTRRESLRVLTGYYRVGWYYKVPDAKDDYMLAAGEARFVAPGFPLHELTPYLRGYRLDRRFRTYKYVIGAETVQLLLSLLRDTKDATTEYVSEIHRLEEATVKRYGYIYNRKYPEGFNWDVAFRPMKIR